MIVSRWATRVVAVLVALVMLVAASPALAASQSVRDPKDAQASVDIQSLSASSGDRLTFRFKVRDLGSKGVFIAHWHGLETKGNPDSASEQMVVVDHRRGRTRVTLWWAIEVWGKAACKGVTSAWRPQRNLVSVSVPLSCLNFRHQTLSVDGHAARAFPYGDELLVDDFPAAKPDRTAHFGLAVD